MHQCQVITFNIFNFFFRNLTATEVSSWGDSFEQLMANDGNLFLHFDPKFYHYYDVYTLKGSLINNVTLILTFCVMSAMIGL